MKKFFKSGGPKTTPFIFTLSTEEREGIPSGSLHFGLGSLGGSNSSNGSNGLDGLNG
jgi:hypothetical protein